LALGASTGGIGLIIGSAVEQKLGGDACAEPLALARFSQAPAASSSAGASGSSSGNSPGGTTTAPSQSKPQSPLKDVGGALKKLFQ
jgi:hypothetical protein